MLEGTLMNRLVIFALLISAVGTHAEPVAPPDSPRGHVPPPLAGFDRVLTNLIAENGVLTAGVGVIDDGNLVWTGYYGEQEPGVPASEKTRFNVASITKTITAETVLRLVGAGNLDLDAPLAPYWVDPDIEHDASDWAIDARLRKRLIENPQAPLDSYRDFYIEHIWERTQFYDGLARHVLNRPVRHTLLIHHNLLNALFLTDLLQMYAQRGWRVINAAAAFEDPIFASEPDILPAGESILWALAKESGKLDAVLRYPAEDEAYERKRMDELGL
jgi:hypothetical protein